MRCGPLLWLLVVAACNGAGLGDRCETTNDCDDHTQCVAGLCRPRCQRAPDCGDGYACGDDGICVAATGTPGDICQSEGDCEAGLACELQPPDDPASPTLTSQCVEVAGGHPAGAACDADGDCRNHTCALGRCVDLCRETRDCGVGLSCTSLPQIEMGGRMFSGCLQASGSLAWNVPIVGASGTVAIAVPASAESVAITMQVDDPNQKVGATRVTDPFGAVLYDFDGDPLGQVVRHAPALEQSVLAMPSSPAQTFGAGMYTLDVQALKAPFTRTSTGTATPTITAVAKIGASVVLDLHFYFLNLDEHPCADKFGAPTLDAETAAAKNGAFQTYVEALRGDLTIGSLAVGSLTFEDLRDHPDLDGLDLASVPALLKNGAHATGINVFFVRSMSPAGVQAFGPNPGPAGLANTAQSGIVVAVDALCYRSWADLARLTTHEIAHYMGLYDNIALDGSPDPIDDTDASSANLMFYSELGGGTDLSIDQKGILGRSPVLQ